MPERKVRSPSRWQRRGCLRRPNDVDPTRRLLALPNVVVVRSLSKAWGLAGLRVGYAAGDATVLRWMRAAGGPYSVSSTSLEIAEERLARGLPDISRVRLERSRLIGLLERVGAEAFPSQANFVLARFDDAGRVVRGLAERGIAVRSLPDLDGCLRITCPGDEDDFARLESALTDTLQREEVTT